MTRLTFIKWALTLPLVPYIAEATPKPSNNELLWDTGGGSKLEDFKRGIKLIRGGDSEIQQPAAEGYWIYLGQLKGRYIGRPERLRSLPLSAPRLRTRR